MQLLFLFMDGVGLGPGDAERNPFARARLPALTALLEGRRLLAGAAPFHGRHASLLGLDACLGVPGLPQSATGQAALLTGRNLPAEIGHHYGPKPDAAVRAFLDRGSTLFGRVSAAGRQAALLNAYPERYFHSIRSGRRLHSAIPQAAVNAGLPLLTRADLYAGNAVSADFTGQGWRERLGHADAPVLEPHAAGVRLAELALRCDFAMFEFWPSDYAGHGQDMPAAVALLEQFDRVLAGLVAAWDPGRGLILLTSDHGNLEDLSTRKHTPNPAACLLIGRPDLRQEAAANLRSLTDVYGMVLKLLGLPD